MRRAIGAPNHAFWPCEVSLTDIVATDRLIGHRQIMDAYLLALAVHLDGCLVTVDRVIPLELVPGAYVDHLVVL